MRVEIAAAAMSAPAYPSLPKANLDALVAYMLSLKKK